MSQLYLFTGENDFTLRQEVHRWQKGFEQKHGEANLSKLEGKKLNAAELYDHISVAPFIAEKRLVCVEGLPSLSKEQVQHIPNIMHEHVLLMFIEPKPDKRKTETKALLTLVKNNICELKEFALLTPAALESWIENEVTLGGGTIHTAARHKLVEIFGLNQFALFHEIHKLLIYSDGQTITKEDVNTHVLLPLSADQTYLSNILETGNAVRFYQYIDEQLLHGESPHKIWNLLLWTANSLGLVLLSIQSGTTNPADIAKIAKLQFPAVKPLLSVVNKAGIKKATTFVKQVATFDIALKTGEYRASGDDNDEILSLIEQCMLTFAK